MEWEGNVKGGRRTNKKMEWNGMEYEIKLSSTLLYLPPLRSADDPR